MEIVYQTVGTDSQLFKTVIVTMLVALGVFFILQGIAIYLHDKRKETAEIVINTFAFVCFACAWVSPFVIKHYAFKNNTLGVQSYYIHEETGTLRNVETDMEYDQEYNIVVDYKATEMTFNEKTKTLYIPERIGKR